MVDCTHHYRREANTAAHPNDDPRATTVCMLMVDAEGGGKKVCGAQFDSNQNLIEDAA